MKAMVGESPNDRNDRGLVLAFSLRVYSFLIKYFAIVVCRGLVIWQM